MADYASLKKIEQRRVHSMPTRNVVLTEHNERMISEMVGSGRYQNASEVLREGLRLVEAKEAMAAARLAAMRDAARVGMDDLEAGRFREFGVDELDEAIAAIGRLAAVPHPV
jgi:antitoxin ParD1/3/4